MFGYNFKSQRKWSNSYTIAICCGDKLTREIKDEIDFLHLYLLLLTFEEVCPDFTF